MMPRWWCDCARRAIAEPRGPETLGRRGGSHQASPRYSPPAPSRGSRGGSSPRARVGAPRPGWPAESPSRTPSAQPCDGDDTGVGERPELRVTRHQDTPMVLCGDDGEGIGVRDREAGLDVGGRQHRRP